MKIYKKITLAFITTSLIAIALISITSYLIARASLATQVIKHLESVASTQNDMLEILFDHNLEKLALVSSRTQLRLSLNDYIRDPQTRYQDKMNRILRDARSSIKNFEESSVLTLDGKVVASTDLSRIGTIHIDEQYFIRGQRESVGDILYLDKNKDLMMHLAGPLILQNKIMGVIEVTAKAQAITSMVTDYSELGETGYMTIVKKVSNGEKFIRSPDRIKDEIPSYTLVDYNDLGQVSRKVLLKDVSAGSHLVDSRGESVLAATRYCEKYDMGLGVKINSTEALSPINRLRNIMILVILFSILSIIMVSILISRSITKPIARLTDVAGRISEGDLELKADTSSKDEVGILAQSFNKMLENLKRDITELKLAEKAMKESEERYRSLIDDVLDTSAIGVFILSSDFKVIWINNSTEEFFGLKKENVIGQDKRQLIQSKTKSIFEDSATFKQKVFATYDNNTYVENFECHVLPGVGRKERWLSHESHPIRSGLYKGGRIEHYEDITDRKKAEKELAKHHDHLEELIRKRTAELQKTINLMAGREVRMAELKEVIRKLRAQVETAGMTPVVDDPLKEM